MQKVEGSNPFSRFVEGLRFAGLFHERSRLVRLRCRVVIGQRPGQRAAEGVRKRVVCRPFVATRTFDLLRRQNHTMRSVSEFSPGSREVGDEARDSIWRGRWAPIATAFAHEQLAVEPPVDMLARRPLRASDSGGRHDRVQPKPVADGRSALPRAACSWRSWPGLAVACSCPRYGDCVGC
jgi:hypothetical protein